MHNRPQFLKGGIMPFTQRKLSSKEIAVHLARAEQLKALGMEIEIPEEWRREKRRCFLNVKIGPRQHSVVYELPNGKVCYEFDVYLLAEKSGIPFPEFEIATPWDKQIAVEIFDDSGDYVRFADTIYPIEEVLNVYAAKYATLPDGRAVHAFLLCTGLRGIPSEYSDHSAADCAVTVRDPGTGEIVQTVVTQITVMRSPKRTDKRVPTKASLYDGDLEAARQGREVSNGQSQGNSRTGASNLPGTTGEASKQNGAEEENSRRK
jgi:hypothetical protein